MAESSTIVIDREYVDNFSIKKYCTDVVIPKYFDDIDASLRSVGLLGYVTELITNYGEDTFNTTSVLFRETFPNRAQVDESIYSHAAIFQLDYNFYKAASCRFLLVLEEASIVTNALANGRNKDTGFYDFHIDKDTTIYIEDIPYTLDYGIHIKMVRRSASPTSINEYEYLFTAEYEIDGWYKNSISEINERYIKIRRSKDGYIALEIRCHQCTRYEYEDNIINNTVLNSPVIDIDYSGNIAGFDVFYKAPGATSYSYMDKQIVYSYPIKTQFCYYQLVNNGTLRLTFNTKDNYFKPEFNSNIKVIIYLTEGASANFESYSGNNIVVTNRGSEWQYSTNYLVAAKPVGTSNDGLDMSGIESLQALTVEGYRTALALTTENDLSEYFSNYKYRYGNADILFLKKRDDIYERVYTAYCVIKDDDIVYKTNTLKLNINLYDLEATDTNTFILNPGLLFTANDNDGYAVLLRDTDKYNKYYAEYKEKADAGEIPFVEDKTHQVPAYLSRPISYAQYKATPSLHNDEIYTDTRYVFDLVDSDYEELDDPSSEKFLLMNPFLLKFTKSPNLVSTYMTYVTNNSTLDFVDNNEDSFVEWVSYSINLDRAFDSTKRYTLQLNLASSILINSEYPVCQQNVEKTDFLYDDPDVVKSNDLRVVAVIMDGEREICYTELNPHSYDEDTLNFKFENFLYTNDFITNDDRIRLIDSEVYREYSIETKIIQDPDDPSISHEVIEPVYTGYYYIAHFNDTAVFTKYYRDDDDNEVVAKNSDGNELKFVTREEIDELLKIYEAKVPGTVGVKLAECSIHKMTTDQNILIPINDVTIKIYTLYHRIWNDELGELVEVTEAQTNNKFVQYDDSFKGYIWTNEYSTGSDPCTFIKPMNSIKTYLYFEDYSTTADNDQDYIFDIMDIEVANLNFIRAAHIRDTDSFVYFMNTVLTNYETIEDLVNTRLRNCTNIDMKFYNTYGRSNNYLIGEDDNATLINGVNISLTFDVWFVSGTDLLTAIPNVKSYIKEQIQTLNSSGVNNIYISNLMRKIETNFASVDHMRFVSINKYDTKLQTVKSKVDDIMDLDVEERRWYVPEMLICDTEDIHINDYTMA